MKLYYQGKEGSYSHLASNEAIKMINKEKIEIRGIEDFASVWEMIGKGNIGVLPIENSYAGSIHENLYYFQRFDYKVIGEIKLSIDHYLLSKEKKIGDIKFVYSHPQALSQCYNFLKKNKIKPIIYSDTAGAAKMISENQIKGAGAIASKFAGKIYNLNVVAKQIQDQENNTTRFFIVCKGNSKLKTLKKIGKITIIFETKNFPAVLYKCLGAFATSGINLTKIESLPSLKDPFTYFFWVDFEGNFEDKKVQGSLKELGFFTKSLKIIGKY